MCIENNNSVATPSLSANFLYMIGQSESAVQQEAFVLWQAIDCDRTESAKNASTDVVKGLADIKRYTVQ